MILGKQNYLRYYMPGGFAVSPASITRPEDWEVILEYMCIRRLRRIMYDHIPADWETLTQWCFNVGPASQTQAQQ